MEGSDLANWPQEMRDYLVGSATTPGAYQRIEDEIGTGTVADFMSGNFYDVLKQAFRAAAPQIPNVVRVEEAPLAV